MIDPQSKCIFLPDLCLLTKSLDHLLQSALTLHQLLTELEVSDDYIPNDSMVKISSAGIFSIAPFLNRTLSWNVNCHFMQYQ